MLLFRSFSWGSSKHEPPLKKDKTHRLPDIPKGWRKHLLGAGARSAPSPVVAKAGECPCLKGSDEQYQAERQQCWVRALLSLILSFFHTSSSSCSTPCPRRSPERRLAGCTVSVGNASNEPQLSSSPYSHGWTCPSKSTQAQGLCRVVLWCAAGSKPFVERWIFLLPVGHVCPFEYHTHGVQLGGGTDWGYECHPFYIDLVLYVPVFQGERTDKGRKGLHLHKNDEGFGWRNTDLLLKQNLGTI